MTQRQRILLWYVVTAIVVALAHCELKRVRSADSPLFELPWESPLTAGERLDARETADLYRWPAMALLAVTGLIAPLAAGWFSLNRIALPTFLWALLSFAIAADLATTIRFFNTEGIAGELHPGMRLFGYAYGRTIGPIIGKLTQLAGIMVLMALVPKSSKWLAWVVIALYVLAAIVNLW